MTLLLIMYYICCFSYFFIVRGLLSSQFIRITLININKNLGIAEWLSSYFDIIPQYLPESCAPNKGRVSFWIPGVLGILFPAELHSEAPGSNQDSMELSYMLRPFWSIQRADVFMQQSCHSHPAAQSSTYAFCGKLVSYPVSFIIKGVRAMYNWISLLFLLVHQILPWNNQLQFSWMKAMSSFSSLHNYLLQPYQILCWFLNLHHTKQKIMSCPGAVQKPWLREIAATKNDGHTHRIKGRIWLPIGQDLHRPLGHWPVLNSFWVSFLLGLESRFKSCVNEKNNWHDWTRP